MGGQTGIRLVARNEVIQDSTNPRLLGGVAGIGGNPALLKVVALLSLAPRHATTTVLDPVELDALVDELASTNTGIVFIQVPFEDLDRCSECPDAAATDPDNSTLQVVYGRYYRIYREPVCGRSCAAQKLRDLLTSRARPDFINVHVLLERTQKGI